MRRRVVLLAAWILSLFAAPAARLSADSLLWDFSPTAIPDDWHIQSGMTAIGNTLWATGDLFSSGRATIFKIDLTDGSPAAYPLGPEFGADPIALSISEGPGGTAWFIGAQLSPGSMPNVADGAFLGEVAPDGTISFDALPSEVFNNNFYPQITYDPASGILAWTQASGMGASFGIGARTAEGEITTAELSAPGAPSSITVGQDGNFYYTDGSLSLLRIGKITPDGVVSYVAQVTYPQGSEPGPGTPPRIVAGTDGNLYFSDPVDKAIFLLTPSGQLTKFAIPGPRTDISSLAYGQDGNIYFGEVATGTVVRLTLSSGNFTELSLPSSLSQRLNLLVPSPLFTAGWGATLATVYLGPGLLRLRDESSPCPDVRNRNIGPLVFDVGEQFFVEIGADPDHAIDPTGLPSGVLLKHHPPYFGFQGPALGPGELLASATVVDSTQCPVDQVRVDFVIVPPPAPRKILAVSPPKPVEVKRPPPS